MIVLSQTTDKLEVVLKTAVTSAQLRCVSCWRDIDTTTYTPGRTVVNTNSTTDVSLVAAPAASTQRVIDFVNIYNFDSVAADVTVKFDANSTEYILAIVALSPGERLEYSNDHGWRVFTTQGALKASQDAPVSTQMSVVVLGSDVVNANSSANTIADVTGLSFSVTSGEIYYFEFIIPYTSAATTTGSRWSINGPASPTLLHYTSEYTLTATSKTVNSATAYDTPSGSNATSLTAGNVATVWGFIQPSSNGTVIARFASEVSSSAITAKAGAICRYMRVA